MLAVRTGRFVSWNCGHWPRFGYHIENEKFVAFLESKVDEFGVIIRNDTVSEVNQDDHGITGAKALTALTVPQA